MTRLCLLIVFGVCTAINLRLCLHRASQKSLWKNSGHSFIHLKLRGVFQKRNSRLIFQHCYFGKSSELRARMDLDVNKKSCLLQPITNDELNALYHNITVIVKLLVIYIYSFRFLFFSSLFFCLEIILSISIDPFEIHFARFMRQQRQFFFPSFNINQLTKSFRIIYRFRNPIIAYMLCPE